VRGRKRSPPTAARALHEEGDEVKATQTNLTKPSAAAAEEGDAADADRGSVPRAEDPGDPEDRRRADQQDAPPDHGHRRTTIPRSRTSCSASASSTPRSSATTSTRRARSIRRSSSCSPTSAGPLQAQQKTYEQQEQKWLLEAVKAYIGATKFRKYERMDEVLFRLAYLLTSVKKEDQAREFFHRLIKDYPNSKYIPDAYLSFAEYYFDKGEMENALKFYEKVEQFPKSSVYPYAVYKKGWCYINLGDYKTALETFVGVVRMTQEGKVNVPKKQLEVLAKEAKKDIVKAYSHVGGPDKAWEFFQKTGGDFAPKMMESLAELYWEEGKFVESTRVYKKVIAQNMDSPRICEWQNKIVRNTLSAGNKRDQVQEIERLGAVYDKVGDMKNAKKDQTEECRNSFHDTSKELALIWHKEAQRTKNQDTYELDKFVYKVFLDHFPKDKGRLRDELLLRRAPVDAVELEGRGRAVHEGRRDEARRQVRQGVGVRGGARVEERAQRRRSRAEGAGREGARGAREEEGKEEARAAHHPRVPEEDDRGLRHLHQVRARRARAGDDQVPEGAHLLRVQPLRRGLELFEDIVNKHPKHELAVYSANLLLDSLNAQGKTKDVVKYVDKFLEMPELMKDPEFGKQMISLKSDTYDIEGMVFEKQRNFKECGRSKLAAAEALPDHPKHAERLWDAAQCFQNAHLVGQALRARLQLIKDHPKDGLALKALFRVAAGYHQLAYYSKAASTTRTSPTSSRARRRRRTRSVTRRPSASASARARRRSPDMDSFVKFYGTRKPQDAAGVYFQMGEVYEKDKKMDDLARHLDAYLKKWGAQGGPDRQVLAHYRLGEMAWKASCPKASETAPAWRSSASPRPAARRSLRPQQEAQEGPEDQGAEAHPVRAAHQLEDHRVRPQQGAGGEGPGALPDRAEDLGQGRGRFEDHRQGRRGARRPRLVRGRGLRLPPGGDGVRSRSCASSSPTASTSSSRASTTTRRRPRRRRRRPRSR
jgi:tetratricopeptide (TPR) repeat protein